MPTTPPRWENLEHAARDAYESYGASVGWKNYRGDAMPAWNALPMPIKQAWGAAVKSTLAKAYRIMAHDLIEHIRNDADRNAAELETKGN